MEAKQLCYDDSTYKPSDMYKPSFDVPLETPSVILPSSFSLPIGDAATRYKEVLHSIYKLSDSSLDMNTFEDLCFATMGTQCFFLFTIDKVYKYIFIYFILYMNIIRIYSNIHYYKNIVL